MIQLVGGSKPHIDFTPRDGFKRSNKAHEERLVYGHKCPACNNVIMACFEAPNGPIDLNPYEVTTVLSQGEKNMGEILKYLPDEKSKPGYSCYESSYHPAGGGSQRIRLKNHIMRLRVILEREWNGEGVFEVGAERVCMNTGVFSIREDLLVKDLLLLLLVTPAELELYNLPTIKELLAIPKASNNPGGASIGFLTPAVGTGPPAMILERARIVYGYNYQLKQILESFRKKV